MAKLIKRQSKAARDSKRSKDRREKEIFKEDKKENMKVYRGLGMSRREARRVAKYKAKEQRKGEDKARRSSRVVKITPKPKVKPAAVSAKPAKKVVVPYGGKDPQNDIAKKNQKNKNAAKPGEVYVRTGKDGRQFDVRKPKN